MCICDVSFTFSFFLMLRYIAGLLTCIVFLTMGVMVQAYSVAQYVGEDPYDQYDVVYPTTYSSYTHNDRTEIAAVLRALYAHQNTYGTHSYHTTHTYNTHTRHGDADIVNVWSQNDTTDVSSSRITVYGEDLEIGIRVEQDNGSLASDDDWYRVAAVYEKRTYPARYTNGYWYLDMDERFSDGDDIRLYVLCRDCVSTTRKLSGGIYDGRRVADSQTYRIDAERYRTHRSYRTTTTPYYYRYSKKSYDYNDRYSCVRSTNYKYRPNYYYTSDDCYDDHTNRYYDRYDHYDYSRYSNHDTYRYDHTYYTYHR